MAERPSRPTPSNLLRGLTGAALALVLGAVLVVALGVSPLFRHALPSTDGPAPVLRAPHAIRPAPPPAADPAALRAAAPLTSWLPAYFPRLEAAAQPSATWVAQLGGASRAIALRERTAFVGVGPRIVAFDLRDPDMPVELGRSPLLPRVVEDIQLAGDLAWVAVGGAGILALDVGRPEAMTIVGAFDTRGRSLSLDVSTDVGLLADKDHLLALDLRDPTAIRELGRWPASRRAVHVTRQGDTAYVTDEREGLHVFDVSDPAALQLIEVLDRDCDARGTVVHGTAAYFHSGCAVHVLDVSDPDHISVVGRLDEGWGYPMAPMAIVGGRLVADGQLFDLADPLAPRRLGAFPPAADDDAPAWGSDMAAADGLAVVTRFAGGGFVSADLTDPAALRPRGEWSTLGGLWWEGLFGLPDEAALDLGGRRIDVRDPAQPVLAGNSPYKAADNFGATTLLVRDDWALVGAGVDETGRFAPLEVVELGPPRRAHTVPAWGELEDAWWFPSSAALLGDIAWIEGYQMMGCPLVAALDLGDVGRPRWVGILDDFDDLPANITRVATDAASSTIVIGHDNGHCDSYGNGPGALTVVDATDPESPAVIEHFTVPAIVRDITTWQGTAYVAADSGGLRVIDLVGAGAPREIAHLDDGDERALKLVLDWPYLWLGYSKNLRLIDIREPARPRELARYDVPSEVVAMTLHHGMLWVATQEAGLLGYRVGP
jgi:hypothetical protein